MATVRPLEINLLGPLEAVVDGRQVALGGARQRAVLAILALHRGEPVSVDRIIDEVWGERSPATATKTVQVYISRLRRSLGEGVVVTRGGGYALDVEPEQVDSERFERLADEGRDALGSGDAHRAAERLREALALWRGEPLADLAYEPFVARVAGRLDERRLAALEDRIEADLALGRHAALIPELETLSRDHPSRERLRAQLMLALYRSGRQQDALASYRDAQRVLVDDLGLEPGPELRRLEQAILGQDPELEAPAVSRPAEAIRRRRQGGALVAFGGGALLAAAIAAILAIGGDDTEPVDANTLAVIDPESNSVAAAIPAGVGPHDVAVDAKRVWVANGGDDTVMEIDPETREVVSTTAPGIPVAGMAAGSDGAWVVDGQGVKLVRIDPTFKSPHAVRIRQTPQTGFGESPAEAVAVGDRAVWLGGTSSPIVRVDPRSDRVESRTWAGNSTSAIAAEADAVWFTDDFDNTVARIDAGSADTVTATTAVGQQPSAVAIGEGAVWVANTQDDTVSRIDPATAAVTTTVPVGERPTGIAVGGGAVWVANSLGGTVSRIDPETNRVEATIEVGEAPQGVVVAHGAVWVTVQARAIAPEGPAVEAAGDTARILVADDPGSTDPSFGVNPQLLYATCANLFSYPDRPFPVGARLIPEVAAGPPAVSDDGRTYTFTIRSGFTFSPPSDEPVTAAAFERAIERALSPKVGSYGGFLLEDVVGASAYQSGKAPDIGGVSAEGDELVVRVTKPVPNLPDRLSAAYFCAVPPDTPIEREGVEPIPAAGPYYVDSHVEGQSLVLRRNPNYDGPRPHELEEIRFSIGTPPERAIEEVEAGRADYVELSTDTPESGVSKETERRLVAEYGPGSEAAEAGRQQLFTQPAAAVFSFAMNTSRGIFADVNLRRAVNYAIDRRALAEVPGLAPPGRPTDQYIPPGIPGFDDVAIYPLGGPDVGTARRLAGDVERRATLYTCNTPGCTSHAGILKSNLRAIGIELDVRQFAIDEMFDRTLRSPASEPWDLAFWGWGLDYPDPFDFINNQFSTGAQRSGGFSELAMDRRMAAAAELSGQARLRAYAALDRELAERFAPQATFASAELTYFLSARMGCQVLHPVSGLDLAALCVREEG